MRQQTLDLKSTRISRCTFKLKLDVRHEDENDICPLTFYFFIDGQRWYYPTGDRMTRDEFFVVSHATGRGRIAKDSSGERPYDTRLRLETLFDQYALLLKQLSTKGLLSMASIKTLVGGISISKSQSFLSIWKSEIATKSIGTRNSYQNAYNSFVRYLGELEGFNITVEHIRKWQDGMYADGLSKTTVGIYLRACRSIWNSCEKYGYVMPGTYPFGKDETQVSIPKGMTRKSYYLDIDHMTALYDIFVKRDYPEEWDCDWKENTHQSLGLFLAQYLCNGCNLADLARLTYNEHYFHTGKKSFQFIRQKTEGRTDLEIIIPIIKPLRYIMRKIAAEPMKGELVFPQIYDGETSEENCHKKVAQANQNIRKRIQRLTDHLGWEIAPSGTWCRHSFATNLSHVGGVPREYIQEAMGHSVGGAVTERYIQLYPLSMQMEFNNKLLKFGKKDDVMEELKTLDRNQLNELIKLVKSKK